MYCRNCGKDNLEGAQVCAGCGALLQAGPQPVRTPQPAGLKTSPAAIWSLVLAILSLVSCGLTAIPGLILGIIASVKINSNRDRLTGQGFAIAGIAISSVTILLVPVLASILFPVFARAREAARSANCLSNVKQIGAAVHLYQSDNGGYYPRPATWSDGIAKYVPNQKVPACVSASPTLRCTYGLNAKLTGVVGGAVSSPDVVLLFESDRGWNAYGGREAMITQPRHGYFSVGCVDGHAMKVFPGYENKLQWNP